MAGAAKDAGGAAMDGEPELPGRVTWGIDDGAGLGSGGAGVPVGEPGSVEAVPWLSASVDVGLDVGLVVELVVGLVVADGADGVDVHPPSRTARITRAAAAAPPCRADRRPTNGG